MIHIQYFAPSSHMETVPPSLPEESSDSPRRHKRLRLYLVGTEADTQSAIDLFHLRRCIERIEWSPKIDVPENGVLIRQDPGDVLRYLQRDRIFE
ncbi:hypothetical protein PN498_19805 [Oscillatoria sp. CS-180]|uniref:hypothetical protein n=1 Tax=Oscillatoria sp. CS-180 TaxID=3021720 RepID=UPI0023309298|nr:hypothetical protein [Oscillatoria sp. CS-180]MDB9528248.1 hypothetical protein [Oscillatoria sp. CS-180]